MSKALKRTMASLCRLICEIEYAEQCLGLNSSYLIFYRTSNALVELKS